MLTIGAVAKRAGVRASAIRYYEAHGVLLPSGRLPNGYRFYEDDAVATLRFVQQAQSFGFALQEVRQLLELARRGQRPCTRVQQLARHHLQSVEAKIQELGSLRKKLCAIIERDVKMPAEPGQICPLIGPSRNHGSQFLTKPER